MIDNLLSSLRVIAIPMRTQFRGITSREVALMQGENGLVEFSPFVEYGDDEAARWLACTLEAAIQNDFPIFRTHVGMNGTIPETNDEATLNEIVSRFEGVSTFKVKVGTDINQDIWRLRSVRTLRPDTKVRIDVNGTWKPRDAATYIASMYDAIGDIEYVEQPCQTIDELRDLKSQLTVPVKIAADEVIRKARDPFSINLDGAADIVVLKVQPLGGIARSLAIAAHHKKPVVVSSALESSVGMAYGVRLAQAIENLQYDCGLATHNLFSGEGVDVAPDRFDWWKNRIMRAAKVLETQ